MNPDLKRATVYLVLSGKYPGKTEEQAAKIRAALHGKHTDAAGPALPREDVALALQSIRCGHCRKLDRRGCPECRRQTEREARDLYARLYPGL